MWKLLWKETSFSPPLFIAFKQAPKWWLQGILFPSRTSTTRAGKTKSYIVDWAPQWDDELNVTWSNWNKIKTSRTWNEVHGDMKTLKNVIKTQKIPPAVEFTDLKFRKSILAFRHFLHTTSHARLGRTAQRCHQDLLPPQREKHHLCLCAEPRCTS